MFKFKKILEKIMPNKRGVIVGKVQIYNSLTKQKEFFEPINSPEVKMYSCGPTVYDRAHVGNFRTYTTVDLLRRVLIANGFNVRSIINITDVGHLTGDNFGDSSSGEDRMEVTSKKTSKTVWDIAREYTDIFFADFSAMNLLPPEKFTKATDHISEQIELIKILEEKGYTYKISDGIYFDTSKFANYGALSNIANEKIEKSDSRIGENLEKKNPRDFALWKFNNSTQKRQMEWDSPWGVGFPGWHIECSAMSMKYLGPSIDIHCGGEDLRETHHPNEIAQSESATGKTFSKYWVHSAFILVDGKRMGKSLGNAYTISDLENKGFSPMDIKYFYYSGHYRKKINLTDESLIAAKNALAKLNNVVKRGLVNNLNQENKDAIIANKIKFISDFCVPETYAEFLKEVSDDLNVTKALSVVWAIARDPELSSQQKSATILRCDEVLGLNLG